MTETEIGKLIELNKSDFEYREWLALKYAQDWALSKGEEPEGDYLGDFRSHYSHEHIEYMHKIVRMMMFMNSLGNTLSRRSSNSEGRGASAACVIQSGEYARGKETEKDAKDHPQIAAHPPVFFGIVLVAGFLLHKLFPLAIVSNPGTLSKVMAGLLFVISGIVMVSTTRLMLRKKTDPRPDRPTSAIVTEGFFRYSRNPLYVSLMLVYAGIGIYANSLCILLLLPVLLLALERGVVVREEAYLERKFGEEYLRYKNNVRRWI